MTTQRRDLLLTAILVWTALVTGVLVWLPLTRGATQGAAYRWELVRGIGGQGTGGDYWMLVVGLVFVLWLLHRGWRGARMPFHVLLLAFHLPLAAGVTWAAVTNPAGFRFEGATLGFDIPLAVIGPVLFCGVAIAAIVWVVRDLRAGRSGDRLPWVWTRATRVRLVILLALIPLEVVLFRSAGLQSPQNVIGVALVGWQWALVNLILSRARSPETK
jgi:hypothetical protein